MIPYTLIRSRRKTVAIRITNEASVEVLAPLRMQKAHIDRFIKLKKEWIESNIERQKQLTVAKSAFTLNYGDIIMLCGKQYPIIDNDGDNAGFDSECFYIPSGLTPDAIKCAVVQIYKAISKRIIKDKVNEYAKLMNVIPSAVRITSAKTRWGSCSGKNSINFSWRLIMADNDVIDYVVVHKLAHIREHNHSIRFWAVVENILPDYRQRKESLKTLQDKLSRENWD